MDDISTDSIAEGVLFIAGSLLAIVVLVMVIRTKSDQVDTPSATQSSTNRDNPVTTAGPDNPPSATPPADPAELV